MFRISALLLALAIMFIPALAESENLISQDMIKADAANYNIYTLEPGAYVRTVSSGATEYYPCTTVVSAEISGARFGEFLVSRGDEVKQGDILATFTLNVDKAALASLELELQRAKEDLKQTLADAEESALEMQRALLSAADSYERELIRLQIQRADIVLEQYQFNQERTIAKLEEQIAEAYAEQEGSVLVAPSDGVILEMAFKRTGENVWEGENLILMVRTDRLLMCVDNIDGAFRYGMEVIVEVGPNKDRTQYPGRVVGADTLLPTLERSGKAYIDFEMPADGKLVRPTVQATTVQLDNVLTIPRNAAAMDGGKYFVTQLVDGVPQKRFINAAANTGIRQFWVLQGLNEGDEIIID